MVGTSMCTGARYSAKLLPFIEPVPGLPHCFAVTGFGGNGTIDSLIAAQMMPRLLRGKQPADADLSRLRDHSPALWTKIGRVQRTC